MADRRFGLHWLPGDVPDGQTQREYVRVAGANVQSFGYVGDKLTNASFLLFGESVPFLGKEGSLSKILVFGRYEEYVETSLISREHIEPTHFICVPYARVLTDSDVKSPRTTELGSEYLRFTSPVRVIGEQNRGTGKHVLIEGAGWIPANAVREIGDYFPDFVEVARTLRGSVYGHGERGGLAGDCSSILQSSCLASGIPCPRIAADIAKEFGVPATGLRRGDVVCWVGHAGIMLDAETVLHSSEWTMGVTEEPLLDLIVRRRATEPMNKREVIGVRRLPGYTPS